MGVLVVRRWNMQEVHEYHATSEKDEDGVEYKIGASKKPE
jgi:hypothetical protein